MPSSLDFMLLMYLCHPHAPIHWVYKAGQCFYSWSPGGKEGLCPSFRLQQSLW